MAEPRSLPCTCLLACTQLDKLRTIIENMLASSSTLLSMSMTPQKTPATLVPGQISPEATCPACSLDLSHQVSMLVQRYEQLQDMVNNLAASRPSKKTKLHSHVSPVGLPPGVATHGPLWGATAKRPTESSRGCHMGLRVSFPSGDPSIGSQRGQQQS